MNAEYVMKILKENGVSESIFTDSIDALSENFNLADIKDFYAIKKGMTNRLFHFRYMNEEYLIRIPGEGTERLLDRYQEAWVYKTLEGRNITDRYIYINPKNGVKITEYITEAHTCDIENTEEVRMCIRHLYHFHQLKLTGYVEFDMFEKLVEYENGCMHDIAEYFRDYEETKKKIWGLKEVIDRMPIQKQLCHVDPVPDNFLVKNGKIYLIDWEYAAVGDPHMDIAMFCIYAGYDKNKIDEVIGFYFKEGCPDILRKKIYAYVAVGGLLWTIWCEIKRDSGVCFDEYEKIQYQYAKDYYDYVMTMEKEADAIG